MAPSPVQKFRQTMRVVYVGRCRHHRMNDFRPAAHADLCLHPEEPLIALLRLVHVRAAFLVFVPRRRRRTDDRRVDDSSTTDLDAAAFQVFEQVLEAGALWGLAFQQVTEATDDRLIRGELDTEVDADEAADRNRVLPRILGRRVGQVEPQLEAIDSEHHLHLTWRAARPCHGISSGDQLTENRPRNGVVRFSQEFRASCRHGVLLKALVKRQ